MLSKHILLDWNINLQVSNINFLTPINLLIRKLTYILKLLNVVLEISKYFA